MSAFFLTFFLIYAGVHAYFYVRLSAAWPLPRPLVALLVIFLAVMVMSPMLVHRLEAGWIRTARGVAFVGYGWMGYLFLFFWMSLCVEALRLLVYLADRLGATLHGLSAQVAFFVPAVAAGLVWVYGWFEAKDVRVERVALHSPHVPPGQRVRVVQISDLHLGLMVREKRLARVVELVREARPDLLVSTGDLVDGQVSRMETLVSPLRELHAPLGKFAVTGNHEIYAGLGQSLEFMSACGFRVLRGEGAAPAPWLRVAGEDDPAAGGSPALGGGSVLSAFPPDTFRLLLKHRPTVSAPEQGKYDLQLSGHIHKGQIFPFSLVTRLFYPVTTGYSPSLRLYVSRGTGTWGPPIRFLAPPEIAVIDLLPAEHSGTGG